MPQISDELIADLRLEIEHLRRHNQTLGAKVTTMEMMYEMVMARPAERYSTGEGVDVLYRLRREIEEQS